MHIKGFPCLTDALHVGILSLWFTFKHMLRVPSLSQQKSSCQTSERRLRNIHKRLWWRGHVLLPSPRTVYPSSSSSSAAPLDGWWLTDCFFRAVSRLTACLFHETTHTWFQKLSILYFPGINSLLIGFAFSNVVLWRHYTSLSRIWTSDDFNKDGHPIYFVTEIIWDSVIN